ncbi:MucR family transcriptional regulator [Croceicoccus bisphenolivorans]|uniref:MucR family transcriptional regulator n=1 Tax=Croceicoccus bisphenolivorans TaxID=1783232 RepID=UPI003CCC3C07
MVLQIAWVLWWRIAGEVCVGGDYRHLDWRRYGLTPEQYRQRWNLPADHPLNVRSERRTKNSNLMNGAISPSPAKRISKRLMLGLTDR